MDALKKEDGESLSIVDENIEALKAILPDAFTEDGIDFEALRQLLGDEVADGEEKYGLTWHGKKKARQIALTPSTGTLRPCSEESVDWNTTQNLFIEGDNLEALKLLQKSYATRVKMIFIDPPYNTGGEFIYPDKFQDNLNTYLKYTGQKDGEGFKTTSNTETSGRFHTNWLNMIYPRIKLARTLLSDDGLFFATIDDHEASSLKKVCDEIFGEENFVAQIAWEKRYTRSNNAKRFYSLKDSIIVFRKSESLEYIKEKRTEKANSNYSNPDNDPLGPWATSSYVNPADKSQRPNLVYGINNPHSGEIVEHPTHAWKHSKSENDRHAAEGRLWWGKDGDAQYPRLKIYLSERTEGLVPIDLWDYKSSGTTDEGGQEIKAIFGSAIFDTPKPTKLLRKMLGIATNAHEENIVLDFFSGSCSTADAVLQENVEDGGDRRFIMIQLPEFCAEASQAYKDGFNTISDIGKERIRRAADRVRGEAPDFKGDLGFKVFKLDSSNIRAWNPDATDLEQTLLDHAEHLVDGRSEQDVLYELLLKRGVDLTIPIEEKTISDKTVYSIGYGVLFACLDEAIDKSEIEALGKGISDWHKALEPAADTQVVFRDSAFADDIAKTNMAAILEQNGIAHVRSL